MSPEYGQNFDVVGKHYHPQGQIWLFESQHPRNRILTGPNFSWMYIDAHLNSTYIS